MMKMTTQQPAPIVAWRATSGSGAHTMILFSAGVPTEKEFDHDSNLFVSLEEDTRIERAPDLDRYAATQRVPPQVLLDNGDSIICNCCGVELPKRGTISEPMESPLKPTVDGHFAYCDDRCRDGAESNVARRDAVAFFFAPKRALVHNFIADMVGPDFYDQSEEVEFVGEAGGDVWLVQGRNRWRCRVDWSGGVTVVDYRLDAPYAVWLEARTREALDSSAVK